MKTSHIILIIIGVIILLCVGLVTLFAIPSYNKIIESEEFVNGEWAKVETQYQRRSDLIPNLVSTVKGYAAHEQSTLDAVVSARAKATQITLSADNLTPENIEAFQAAQSEVSSALSRLLAVAENYPDLKANQNFLELQAQLEGTENRIAVARTRYTESVKSFNVMIRRFPASIIASMFGFEKKPQFEATEGAETAPVVNF